MEAITGGKIALIAIFEAAFLYGWWKLLSWWENRQFWKKRRPFPSGAPEDECVAALKALEWKMASLEGITALRSAGTDERGKCRHFICIEIPEKNAQRFLDELAERGGKFIDLGAVMIVTPKEI